MSQFSASRGDHKTEAFVFNHNENNLLPTTAAPLLTGGQVAKILNVSRSFAYQLMRTGEIPTVRLGRAVRVRPEDLKNFVETNLDK